MAHLAVLKNQEIHLSGAPWGPGASPPEFFGILWCQFDWFPFENSLKKYVDLLLEAKNTHTQELFFTNGFIVHKTIVSQNKDQLIIVVSVVD